MALLKGFPPSNRISVRDYDFPHGTSEEEKRRLIRIAEQQDQMKITWKEEIPQSDPVYAAKGGSHGFV